MSIAQTTTTSFRVELLQAIHNFGPSTPNTFKLALYTGAANIGPNTLTISTSPTSGNNTGYVPTAYISFANTSWPNASFTCRGALIYNVSQGNKSVAVLDFGSDKTVSNDTFQIIFPASDANSAIVRIS